MDKIKTVNVTVLTPPAVLPGEPPINIKIMDKSLELTDKLFWSIEKKPAVLVVIDWNSVANIFCPNLNFLMVKKLLPSYKKNNNAPPKTKIILATIENDLY